MVESAVTVTTVRIVSRSLSLRLRQDRGDGQRRRGAADADRAAGQHAEAAALAEQAREQDAQADRGGDAGDHRDDRHDAEARICSAVICAPSSATPIRRTAFEANSMPGDAAAFLVQEVEGHAEQQREQHHRRAVVLRQPGRGERDGRARRARPGRPRWRPSRLAASDALGLRRTPSGRPSIAFSDWKRPCACASVCTSVGMEEAAAISPGRALREAPCPGARDRSRPRIRDGRLRRGSTTLLCQSCASVAVRSRAARGSLVLAATTLRNGRGSRGIGSHPFASSASNVG